MTHAFFLTLGALAGVMVGLAVLVAAAQIILRFFVWPAFWGITASLIAICALLTFWEGYQREFYLHSIEYKQEKAKEAEARHQLQQQRDLRFRNSKAET